MALAKCAGLPKAMNLRLQNLYWLLATLLVVALDQWSKIWISRHFQYGESLNILPFFDLVLAHNYGAAFSFLSDAGGWQRWFFTGIAAVVSLLLVVWIARLKTNEKMLAFALAFILGGAIGNLIDRIQFGYVVDFLRFYVQQWSFPAFNLADSAITLGAILVLWDAFFGSSKR